MRFAPVVRHYRECRRFVGVLVFGLACAASCCVPIANAHSIIGATSVDANGHDPSATARDLTSALVRAAARYAAAAGTDRAARLGDVVAIAQSRRDALSALLETNPGAVLAVALSSSQRANFPVEAMTFLEREALEDGELEVYHVDHRDPSLDRYRYLLNTTHGEVALHFADVPPALLTGARLRVQGVRIGDALALGGHGNSVKQVAAAPAPGTLGELRTLVVLVNFQDNAVQPYGVIDAQTVVFGTTSNFLLENSYGQTWLGGDVAGWFTIPASASACDTGTIATQTQAAATAAGINLAMYAHLVYAFPQNACGWWGMSTVGGNPSQTWINGDLELAVAGHELGHALGLWHSHALDCGSVAVGGTCNVIEYGDLFDKMGGSTYPGHYNSFQKERLGWLDAGASPPITTVQTSGSYALDAYETPGSGAKALKILKSTDPATGNRTWYYVEARKAVGFDDFLASVTNNAANGVLIHTGSDADGNSSNLVDSNPATDTSIWDWLVDAPLVAGQSFRDPDSGATITAAWVSAAGAGITVSFAPTKSSASVAVATDHSSYTLSQSVSISATVSDGTSPVSGAKVNFSVKKSNGAVIAATATTDASGKAVYQLRLSRRDPLGSYEADASALSARGTAYFTVN